MKNICTRLLLPKIKTPIKTNRAMKLTCALLLTASMGVFATGNAQTMRVNIQADNVSTGKILSEIEKQTDYLFVYNKKEVDLKRKTSVNAVNKTTAEVLSTIFDGTDVIYAIEGENIMLMRKEKNMAVVPDAVQQDNKITGTVLDPTGMPVIGANIMVKGTTNGTITDMDGKFSLEVNPKSVLVCSFIGYETVEISVEKMGQSPIIMREDLLGLDEVIVTGYTSQRKADLTGSVSVVKADDIRTGIKGNAMRSLQGKVAGMSVGTNGTPNPDATIRIRGEGTLNNNDPLYIIDGTPTKRSMGELASLDIETIQVLKDASSASIYGARAANGVIIITTRKGSKGTKVEANVSYTLTSNAKPYDLMNTYERGVAQYWAIKNDNPNADPNIVGIGQLYQYKDHLDNNGNFVLDEVSWKEYIDEEKTMRSADTDWQKEILRLGQVQQYNLTLSTGSEKGRALFALDYYDNKGTIKGSYYNRFNARINSDYSFLNDHIQIGENFTVSKWRNSVNIGDGNLNACKQLMSIVPVHTVDGEGWGGPVAGMSDRHNQVRVIEDNKQNYNDAVRLFGNAFININFIKGLTFRSNFGIDAIGNWSRVMNLRYKSGFMSEERNSVSQNANYTFNWNNSNTLQYVFDVDKHNFDVLLGQETISNSYHWFSAARNNYLLETDDYMQLSAGEKDQTNAGSESNDVMISWFGKINYNYDNRYLVSFTMRRDGSSVFGVNNRWGTFPAFSFGWSLKNEPYLDNALSFFSQLKLRYGWGVNGNSSIDAYAYAQMYDALYDSGDVWGWNWGTAYDITGNAGTLPSGFRRTQRGNPNLKWESTSQHNMGFDFGILEGRFSGSFDYYLKSTKDILLRPGFIATLGEGATMWTNGASIDNKGFELTLTYTDKIGDLGINVNGVFSRNRQKVTNIPEESFNSFPGNGIDDLIIGHPTSAMYGYVADGLFQSEDEVKNHAEQVGAAAGRIRYKDLNNDGVINSDDRTWIGDGQPDLAYGISLGLNYKNFDLNLFFNGVFGNDINVQSWKSFTDFYGLTTQGENYGTRLLNAWRPDNKSSTIPAITLNNYNDEGRFSTYYVESGSYLKLRNIELGYTIPQKSLENLKIDNLRFYLRADNILTLMKTWGKNEYTGLDPETPGSSYPLPFSMTVGLNLSF